MVFIPIGVYSHWNLTRHIAAPTSTESEFHF